MLLCCLFTSLCWCNLTRPSIKRDKNKAATHKYNLILFLYNFKSAIIIKSLMYKRRPLFVPKQIHFYCNHIHFEKNILLFPFKRQIKGRKFTFPFRNINFYVLYRIFTCCFQLYQKSSFHKISQEMQKNNINCGSKLKI